MSAILDTNTNHSVREMLLITTLEKLEAGIIVEKERAEIESLKTIIAEKEVQEIARKFNSLVPRSIIGNYFS